MPTFAKNDDEVKNKYLFAVTATCFLILFITSSVRSQKVETYSVENGLPRGYVSSICQDKKGFIWAATPDGVCRFDGERFKLFSDSDKRAGSLASKYVSRFYFDRDSAMWLMVDHQMYFYDDQKNQFIESEQVWKRASPQMEYLTDQSGHLWLLSDSVYCYQMNAGSRRLIEIPEKGIPLPFIWNQSISEVMVDSGLVYATDEGVFSYNFQRRHNIILPIALSGVLSIWVDKETGLIWLISQKAIGQWDGKTFRQYTIAPRMRASSTQGVRIGRQLYFFAGEQALRWNGDGFDLLEWEIDARVNFAMKDRQNNLWLGTDSKGIRKVSLTSQHVKVLNKGTYIGNKKLTFDKSGEVLFFDIDAVSAQTPQGTYIKANAAGLTGSIGYATGCDKNGNIWVVNDRILLGPDAAGAGLKPRLTFPLTHADDYIQEIFFTNAGLVAISDYLEIYFCSANLNEYWHIELQEYSNRGNRFWHQVNDIIEARNDEIIMSCSGGLFLLTPDWNGRQTSVRYYGTQKGDPLERLWSIHAVVPAADDSGFWIGTPKGLYRSDANLSSLKHIETDIIRKNDVIFSMVESGGELWLGTQRGLIWYDPQNGNSRLFTEIDGLPNLEFNRAAAARSPDGQIYMGTVGGLIAFDPKQIKVDDTSIFNMVITDIALGDSVIAVWRNQIKPLSTLRYDQNNITLSFALMNLNDASANIYQYRLNGGQWISVYRSNSVALAGLAPGKYTFEVRGGTGRGNWSEPAKIQFEIAFPWWKTWWAYAIYTLTIISIISFGFGAWSYLQKLKNEALMHEQEAKLKAESERLRMRLLGNITHEIRTPLTIILGIARQLRMQLTGKLAHESQLLEHGASDLLELSNQVLYLSSEQKTGRFSHVREADLAVFVHQAAEYFQYQCRLKSIQFNLNIQPASIWARYDEFSLKSVLSNLLSNAVKFTPEGGSIDLSITKDSENELRIVVCDRGIGMDAETQSRLFERFFQAEHAQKASGLGIGLSYVKEVVEQLGGHISVSSKEGEGSVFEVKIPLTPIPPQQIDESFRPDPSEVNTPAEISPANAPIILIVEDNPSIVRYYQTCFGEQYHLLYAFDAHEALEIAKEQIPDLILSDIMMPGMNGLEFCRQIKAHLLTAHIPVVFATALVEETDKMDGLRAGADAYINKPFEREELSLIIGNLLSLKEKLRERWRENPAPPELGQIGMPPEAPTEKSISNFALENADMQDKAFLEQVMRLIEENFQNSEFKLADLQQMLGLSKTQLYRKMMAITGLSAGHFLRKRRLEQAMRLLVEQPSMNITEVAYACGFDDPNYFSTAFSAEYGAPPSQFRK